MGTGQSHILGLARELPLPGREVAKLGCCRNSWAVKSLAADRVLGKFQVKGIRLSARKFALAGG
jgi:hypothetical protein